MARSERGASPQRAVTTERRSQSPLCLAPSTVALILALAFVARLAEIALDIGATLRALANAKIHSNAAHSNISRGSQCSVFCSPPSPWQFLSLRKPAADYPARHSRNRSFQPRSTLINPDNGLVNKRNYLAKDKHRLSQIPNAD